MTFLSNPPLRRSWCRWRRSVTTTLFGLLLAGLAAFPFPATAAAPSFHDKCAEANRHLEKGNTSSAFQALLHFYHILPSMSAAGNCYDNAAMESFWSTLKGELIPNRVFCDLEEFKLAVFDYLGAFYTRERLHSALDFKSPVEFEQQLAYEKS